MYQLTKAKMNTTSEQAPSFLQRVTQQRGYGDRAFDMMLGHLQHNDPLLSDFNLRCGHSGSYPSLRYESLGIEDLRALAGALKDSTYLKTFNLISNFSQDEGVRVIANAVKANKTIKSFN